MALTVGGDVRAVEQLLIEGRLACPCCGGPLGPWGWARWRVVGRGEARVRLRPRRGRCRRCRVTQVLLAAVLLVRRADLVELIGAALLLLAGGVPMRRVARTVGVPRSTVRGWAVRFAAGARRLRAHFTRWLVWLAPQQWLGPTGGEVGDAVAAIVAAGGRRCTRRRPGRCGGSRPRRRADSCWGATRTRPFRRRGAAERFRGPARLASRAWKAHRWRTLEVERSLCSATRWSARPPIRSSRHSAGPAGARSRRP